MLSRAVPFSLIAIGAVVFAGLTACGSSPEAFGGYNAQHGGAGQSSGGAGSAGSSTGGSTTTDPRQFYIENVDTPLRQACGSCHETGMIGAPIWLASDAAGSYTQIHKLPGLVATPQSSLLLTKGPHEGPALPQALHDLVGQWLTMEMSSGSSGGGPPLTLDTALTQVGRCMDIAQFTDETTWGVSAADIAQWQATLDDGTATTCNGCHNLGDGGFWASNGMVGNQDTTKVMFSETQQYPYILKWVAPKNDQGTFVDLTPSNAILAKGELAKECVAQNNGNPCHPVFELSKEQWAAIVDFVQTTIDKWHNGGCW
jgi:hypothetical protein